MGSVSPLVTSYAARVFPNCQSEMLEQLAALNEPSSEPDWAATRESVQMAVLLVANGSSEHFSKALKWAAADWRDVLVSAGLAGGDWQAVLARIAGPLGAE